MSGNTSGRLRIIREWDETFAPFVDAIAVDGGAADRAVIAMVRRESAEPIVRCVNALEGFADPDAAPGLLEAARAAVVWVALATGRDPNTTSPLAIRNAKVDLDALQAAIARAEGGSA